MSGNYSHKQHVIRAKGIYLFIIWSVLITTVFGSVTGSIALTDTDGVEQLNFAAGSTLYIKITDSDLNRDRCQHGYIYG